MTDLQKDNEKVDMKVFLLVDVSVKLLVGSVVDTRVAWMAAVMGTRTVKIAVAEKVVMKVLRVDGSSDRTMAAKSAAKRVLW